MDDALSDVLRLIRLKSCVYFVRDFHAPWGMEMDSGPVAQFHAVVRGDCVVETGGQSYSVTAGDIILFPRGSSHVLADRAGHAAIPGPQAMASFGSDRPLFAEGDSPTQLVCGHFEHRDDIPHPLLTQLPEIILVHAFDALSPGTVDSVLPLLVREMQHGGPGAATAVERLAEVLLIQILRAHLTRERAPRGFLSGLTDPRLARAIGRVHREAESRLTLDSLAHTAGMSRSAFAAHFKGRIGLSPIEYLTKWRMYRAGELLRGQRLPLDRVAEKVGYDSAISFIRAFKREFKVSPGQYRRAGAPTPGA
jgi:AraC family transcriptional regulator, activator of mtrCDE